MEKQKDLQYKADLLKTRSGKNHHALQLHPFICSKKMQAVLKDNGNVIKSAFMLCQSTYTWQFRPISLTFIRAKVEAK